MEDLNQFIDFAGYFESDWQYFQSFYNVSEGSENDVIVPNASKEEFRRARLVVLEHQITDNLDSIGRELVRDVILVNRSQHVIGLMPKISQQYINLIQDLVRKMDQI